MLNNSLKLCFIALLTLGLAFTTACGGDDDDNNGNNSNPDLNNDNNSNPNNSNPNNSNPNNSNPNNSNPNNSNPNNNTGGETNTFCQENPTAERCTADPAEFAFGAFSNITKFEIAPNSGDDACCFDFDGDQDVDNQLGFLLSIALNPDTPPMMDSVNETIAENIADGTLALILEHDGLTDLSAGGDYTVNFFLGKYDGDDLLINPASFDQGAQPLAYLPGANLTGTDLKAGPGNVMLSLELFGATLDLSVRQARITAEVDEANSSIEDGVTLTTGKLGGLIVINEVVDAINTFADTCECLPLDGKKLIAPDENGSLTCHASVGTNPTHTCDAEEPCGLIASNCLMIPLVATMGDQTVNGQDAISVGATFEAEAVTVAGIAAE